MTVTTYYGVHMPPKSASIIDYGSFGTYVITSGSVYLSGNFADAPTLSLSSHMSDKSPD